MSEVIPLKAEPCKDLAVYGNGNLCVSLLAAGVLDALRIIVNPMVIGAGTPWFAGISHPFIATLAVTRRFQSDGFTYRAVECHTTGATAS